jgi:putative methyltransferase (TIGR04325 family)
MNLRVYKSFEDALNNSKSPEGYSNQLLARVVADKTKRFRDQLRDSRQLDLGALRTSVFLSLIRLRQNEIIKVLDFGGACGYHYYICNALLPEQRFDWKVIETASMVEAAKKDHESEELSFFTMPDQATEYGWTPDALIASSSIQYLENPITTWESLLALKSSIIFITRTPLSKLSTSTIMLQTSQLAANGPGPLPEEFEDLILEYPITYIPKSMIISSALKNGYKLSLSILEENATLFSGEKPVNTQESLFFTNFSESNVIPEYTGTRVA